MQTEKQLDLFIKTPMDMVKEYAEASGQDPDYTLYEDLVVEEYKEWVDAFLLEDELKEAADLVYVLYGWANVKGYDLDEALLRGS